MEVRQHSENIAVAENYTKCRSTSLRFFILKLNQFASRIHNTVSWKATSREGRGRGARNSKLFLQTCQKRIENDRVGRVDWQKL